MKRMLAIINRPPYESSHGLERLEAAMVGAVFDFSVSLLFRGPGVWYLQPQQDASAIGWRTLGKVLTALPTYDIRQAFVCAPSLQARGIELTSSVLDVTSLDITALDFGAQGELIANQDIVLGGGR